MKLTKTYSEKLKDPRWQKKRLEVLEQFDFTCLECSSKDKTLHVHHRYYEKNREPWEYPSRAYVCLCEDCHDSIEVGLKACREQLGYLTKNELGCIFGILQNRYGPWSLEKVFEYSKALFALDNQNEEDLLK